jgi:hypothetical protein
VTRNGERVRTLGGLLVTVATCYVVSWHVAFVALNLFDQVYVVIGWSPVAWAHLYWNNVAYLWRPGLEMASGTQVLALIMTLVATPAYYIVRRSLRSKHRLQTQQQ